MNPKDKTPLDFIFCQKSFRSLFCKKAKSDGKTLPKWNSKPKQKQFSKRNFKNFRKISKFKVLDRKDILQKLINFQTAYQKLGSKSVRNSLRQGSAIDLRRKNQMFIIENIKEKHNDIGFRTET